MHVSTVDLMGISRFQNLQPGTSETRHSPLFFGGGPIGLLGRADPQGLGVGSRTGTEDFGMEAFPKFSGLPQDELLLEV